MADKLKISYNNYAIILKHLEKKSSIEEIEKFWIPPPKGLF